jgi:phosphoribosylamine--glycine ligase
MQILVIGSGGREHAIVRTLARSPEVETIFVAPGNGGTALETKAVNVDLAGEGVQPGDRHPAVDFALDNDIDLVVIGPEVPLVEGLADELRAAGILVFGPGSEGAQLEGSKKFSKDFMTEHNIPTAAYFTFTGEEQDAAFAKLAELGAPVVIKADGLAAGKGVTVAATLEEAQVALTECFEGRFGDAGTTVVIEECLSGPECSIIAFVDALTVIPLAPSQDHKRLGAGDTGPNTGGMGVYSPVPLVSDEQYAQMVSIMERTARALVHMGIDYRGVLYGGFMLTADGPKVLEYNVRFGDPETQVILPRLNSDLAAVMLKTAAGELAGTTLEFDPLDAVSVVVASAGYPGTIEKGFPITGIHVAEEIGGVEVFHAGTMLLEDAEGRQELVTAGGRVLNVTALAPTFEAAIANAYAAVEKIHFTGAFSRPDIGQRALM